MIFELRYFISRCISFGTFEHERNCTRVRLHRSWIVGRVINFPLDNSLGNLCYRQQPRLFK